MQQSFEVLAYSLAWLRQWRAD